MSTAVPPISTHPITSQFQPRLAASVTAAASFAGAAALSIHGLDWGKKELVRTIPQHLDMALITAGVLLTIPLCLHLALRAGKAGVAAAAAITGQLLVCAGTIQSNILGHDTSYFAAVAGVGSLLWVGGLVTVAAAGRRRRVLTLGRALALVATFVATIPMGDHGGGLIAAALWLYLAGVR